jgi:predicted DNA-binding transcriptional regulator AlpA
LPEEQSVNTPDQELVSVRTLSRLLDISEKTIWDWIYKSRREATLDPIPYYKLGGLVRFRLRDIRAWVDRRRVRPPPLSNSRLD